MKIRLPRSRWGKALVFAVAAPFVCLGCAFSFAVAQGVGQGLGLLPTSTPTPVSAIARLVVAHPTAAATAKATIFVADTPVSSATPESTQQPPARPTEMPKPSDTVAPTVTDRPNPTPEATYTPLPSSTPKPSSTPAPTATHQPSPTAKPTNTPLPTRTLKASNTPPPTATDRPSPTLEPTSDVEARLVNIAHLNKGSVSVVGGLATVEYEPSSLTEGWFIDDFAYTFAEFASKAFQVAPEIDYLTMRGNGPLVDKYGNETTETAISFTISRDVANKINWQNIRKRDIGPLLSDEPECEVYVLPALQPAWQDYISG